MSRIKRKKRVLLAPSNEELDILKLILMQLYFITEEEYFFVLKKAEEIGEDCSIFMPYPEKPLSDYKLGLKLMDEFLIAFNETKIE